MLEVARYAVGSLASELASLAERHASGPRVYADANVPAGLVSFMRRSLGWDVFFVMEHDELRRASDDEHFRLSHDMRRILVTLDRDYFDDRRFPPSTSAGVVVLSAPDERQLARVLGRVDRFVLRGTGARMLQRLDGLKLHAHLDWPAGPVALPESAEGDLRA